MRPWAWCRDPGEVQPHHRWVLGHRAHVPPLKHELRGPGLTPTGSRVSAGYASPVLFFQDLGALKIPEQYRMIIWRGLQELKQSHDYGAQQLIRSSSNASTISIGSSGELQRQRVMEAVHFRVRHTITIPNRGGADEWADFGFDLPDCKSRKQSIKEEFTEGEIN